MSHPTRVMIVDDDDGVREVLTLALRAEGYDVESARAGTEGLAALARRPADIVIVDMRMPDVSGSQFCHLYARQAHAPSPVILMTAMAGHVVGSDLPGVVEVLAKPFDLETLLDVVERSVAAPSRG